MSTHVNWTMFEVVASTSFYVLTVYDSIFFWKIIIENPDMIEPHMHAETIAKILREKKNLHPFFGSFHLFLPRHCRHYATDYFKHEIYFLLWCHVLMKIVEILLWRWGFREMKIAFGKVH